MIYHTLVMYNCSQLLTVLCAHYLPCLHAKLNPDEIFKPYNITVISSKRNFGLCIFKSITIVYNFMSTLAMCYIDPENFKKLSTYFVSIFQYNFVSYWILK